MNNDQAFVETVETEGYSDIPLRDYQVFEWYAAQMELTVDYLLDEFLIDGTLVISKDLVDYDYECASSQTVH